MKAVVIDAYGGSDRLQVREVGKPTPASGEVLIRVHAASVNPIDWKMRRGKLRAVLWLRFPAILGCDVAGVVEEVGPGVSRLQVGDPVLAMLRHGGGGYAQYVAAPEAATARKPDALSFEEAAAVPVAALTALQALRDLGRLAAGQAVLVNGASGGVGSFAVQIAKAMSARATGVCGPANVELVGRLGADVVVDYSKEDFTRATSAYDLIFDAVAKSSFSNCAPALRPRGRYVTTLPSLGLLFHTLTRPLAGLLAQGKQARVVFAQARAADLELVGRLADQGKLRPVIDRIIPLEDAKEAHDYSETERTRGKIVLRVT